LEQIYLLNSQQFSTWTNRSIQFKKKKTEWQQ
jgi:hypothetical protein